MNTYLIVINKESSIGFIVAESEVSAIAPVAPSWAPSRSIPRRRKRPLVILKYDPVTRGRALFDPDKRRRTGSYSTLMGTLRGCPASGLGMVILRTPSLKLALIFSVGIIDGRANERANFPKTRSLRI